MRSLRIAVTRWIVIWYEKVQYKDNCMMRNMIKDVIRCMRVYIVRSLMFRKGDFPLEEGTLILAPHPDDEIIGCGGLIIRLVEQGFMPTVITLSGGAELVVVPLLVYVIVRLTSGSFKVKKILIFIGSVSMNIWFLHGLFFTGFRDLQPLLYYPRYSVLVFLWGLFLLIPSAWVISQIYKAI